MKINFKGKRRQYQLAQDERQFILYEVTKPKTGKKKGAEIYTGISYSCSLEHILNKVLHLEILDRDSHSFAELFAAIREAKEFIGTLVLENSESQSKEA